jgi:hypothetical protein
VRPLLDEPWVLDVDATIKPLYGHQEGAVVDLRVEVHPGDQHNPKHAAAGLWSLLAQLGCEALAALAAR